MPPKADHSGDHNVSDRGTNDSDEGMMSATAAAPAGHTAVVSGNEGSHE